MEKALVEFEQIKNAEANARKTLYEIQKLRENYDYCINQCKRNNDYVLCLYDETSTIFAITTIKIYEPACSNIKDYTNVISFETIMENDVLLPFPNHQHGLIPNYKYVIGDPQIFYENHVFHSRDEYYLVDLKIPIVM
jgi:hypothetical protein